MLVLAWKLDAQSMGYFTLQEWLRGMGSLQYVRNLVFLSVVMLFSILIVYVCSVFSVFLVFVKVP